MNDTSTSVFTEFFELRSFIVQFDGEDYVQPHVRIIHTHTLTKKNKHLNTRICSMHLQQDGGASKNIDVLAAWATTNTINMCYAAPSRWTCHRDIMSLAANANRNLYVR